MYPYIDVIGVNYHFFFILKLVTAEETFKPLHTNNKWKHLNTKLSVASNGNTRVAPTRARCLSTSRATCQACQPRIEFFPTWMRVGVFNVALPTNPTYFLFTYYDENMAMDLWENNIWSPKTKRVLVMLHSFPCIPITSSLALTKVDTHWELPISAESFRMATNYYQLFALIGLNIENPWVSRQQYGNCWWKKSCAQVFLFSGDLQVLLPSLHSFIHPSWSVGLNRNQPVWTPWIIDHNIAHQATPSTAYLRSDEPTTTMWNLFGEEGGFKWNWIYKCKNPPRSNWTYFLQTPST